MIALVLAAGQGRRMGGPKALLVNENGQPLAWAHALERYGDCRTTVIVARADVVPVLERCRPAAVHAELIASKEADELGPAGSIRAAMQALSLGQDEWVLLSPVDCPPAPQATVEQLVAASHGVDAVRPRVEGRGGHPVLLRAAVLAEYRQQARPLRDVLRAMSTERIRDVQLPDRSLLNDFDTPTDWGRTPHFVE